MCYDYNYKPLGLFAHASHVFMPTRVCLALILALKYIALALPQQKGLYPHTYAPSNSPFRGPSSPQFRYPITTINRFNSIRLLSVQRNFGPRQPKQMGTRNYSNSFGTATTLHKALSKSSRQTNFSSRFSNGLRPRVQELVLNYYY